MVLLIDTFLLLYRWRHFITRCCFGQRKITKKHRYPLVLILKKLYGYISSGEELLRIERESHKNLTLVEEVMKEGMEITGNIERLMAGSTAERFSLPIVPSVKQVGRKQYEFLHAIFSDFDYMISCIEDKASFTSDEEKYFICSENAELKPGFVHLLTNQEKTLTSASNIQKLLYKVTKVIKVKDLEGYIPPRNYCYGLVTLATSFGQINIKGPAIEIRLGGAVNESNCFYSDFTFTIKCSEWPDKMSDWTYRPDKLWPDPSDVTRIASYGCHLVPKSQPDDKEGLTWRISFSKAEVELSKLIPPTARICLIGLKIIAKDYLSVTCSKITSYHLKSLLLYALERTNPLFWLQESNLEQCFHLLFGRLLDAVTDRYCPHFWIPQINLFENLTEPDAKKLTKVLRKILKSPASFIEDLDLANDAIIANLNTRPVNLRRDYGFCRQEGTLSRSNKTGSNFITSYPHLYETHYYY